MIKKRLLQLLGKQRKYIIYQILWQWISLFTEIGFVWQIASVIEAAYSVTFSSSLLLNRTLFAALFMAVRYLCSRMQVRTGYKASADVKRILREKIYQKLLGLGPSYREQVSSAEIVSMTTEGVEQLETYFSKYLPQFFYALLAPVTLFFVLKNISLKSAVVLLAAVPLIPIVIMVVMKVARKLLDHYFQIYYGLADTFLEKLHGLTTLKVYQADEQAAKDMAEESEQFRKVTMKVLGMQLNSTAIMDLVAYGGTAVGFVTALSQYQAGAVNLFGMIMILFLGAEFFLPMRLLGSYFHIGMNGMKASDRMFAFLDAEEPADGTEEVDASDPSIVLDHVSFSYEADRPILKDISMKIPAGSFVAIAGVSGSGKSTLAGILSGRNRNFSGSVTIGGKPVQSLSTSSRIRHMTLVAHDSVLFSGTIRDNLKLGNPDASDEEMKEVLHSVALDEFADDLSMVIHEQGSDLSGGQRQRLCFARALLHNSEIYIFDEAASSIDMESEAVIMHAIRNLAGKRTILLITHRLADAEGADQIYLLSNGTIAESGTQEEMMAENGLYARMYSEQKKLEDYTLNASVKDQPRTVINVTSSGNGHVDAVDTNEKKRRSGFAIMRKLIVLVKPLAGVMALGIALGVVGYLCAIFVTVLAAKGAAMAAGGSVASGLFAVILLIAAARGFLHYGEQYCNHYIAFRLLALIRNKVFAALQKLAPAKLDGKGKGSLISLITSDIELLEVFYAHTISPIAIAAITSVILCIYIGQQYLPAVLCAIGAYAMVGILIPLFVSHNNAQKGMKYRTAFAEMNSYLLESVMGVYETIQYGGEEQAVIFLQKRAMNLSTLQKDLSRDEERQSSFTNLMIQLFSWIMVMIMASAYGNGSVGLIAMLCPIAAMMSSFGPTAALASLSTGLTQTLASGERVLSLLEEEPAVAEVTSGRNSSFTGADLNHVSFAYEGADVLQDLSMQFPEGKIIGIHGPSGCGKSTILKLLMRFYDVDQGSVDISSLDVKKINTNCLRGMESYVLQDTWLFSGTIAENISLRKPDVTMKQIEEAARMAKLDGLIASLPHGYDTKLGELGDTLSGGERQRIGIARAFLHGGTFILLDEPTSNLDALNEGMIMKTVKESSQGKTIVLVSHRNSTLSIADQIYDLVPVQA